MFYGCLWYFYTFIIYRYFYVFFGTNLRWPPNCMVIEDSHVIRIGLQMLPVFIWFPLTSLRNENLDNFFLNVLHKLMTVKKKNLLESVYVNKSISRATILTIQYEVRRKFLPTITLTTKNDCTTLYHLGLPKKSSTHHLDRRLGSRINRTTKNKISITLLFDS